MTKIVVFVGSLRADSLNKKLAQNLEELAPEGTTFDYVDLNVPLYNTELEEKFPAKVQKAKDQVEAADGILIVTPEYNRSIPGVLKNAIDWISRPYGFNSFDKKPLAIAGASIGPVGTAVAQSDLRHIAGYLNMCLVGQPELYLSFSTNKFDETGKIQEGGEENLKSFIASYIDFIKNA